MKKLNHYISRFLEFFTLFSSAAFIGVVLLQIFARFALESAPSWTEEAARIFFIYTISFASGLALHGKYYVQMDIVYNLLAVQWQKLFDVINALLVFILFGIMVVYSLNFIQLGIVETSPSLRIPMAFPFGSMFIMSGFICYYSILDFISAFKALRS